MNTKDLYFECFFDIKCLNTQLEELEKLKSRLEYFEFFCQECSRIYLEMYHLHDRATTANVCDATTKALKFTSADYEKIEALRIMAEGQGLFIFNEELTKFNKNKNSNIIERVNQLTTIEQQRFQNRVAVMLEEIELLVEDPNFSNLKKLSNIYNDLVKVYKEI